MFGLAGVRTMPLSAKGPAHVVKDRAKDPANNNAKKNRIFFIRIPPGNETAKLDLHDAILEIQGQYQKKLDSTGCHLSRENLST